MDEKLKRFCFLCDSINHALGKKKTCKKIVLNLNKVKVIPSFCDCRSNKVTPIKKKISS
jgi:hypothetical protein